MKWRAAGKRSLSWIASLALCAGGLAIGLAAPAAEPTENPVYLDTSYSFAERAADLVSRMTLTEKASQLGNQAAAIPRLGVARYDYWSEALHGVARSGEATVFPTGYGIAQTWNRDLVQKMMEVTSDEARAYNNEKGKGLSYWSPTINMSRDPRWGRTEETYGEDPYLTTEIGSSFVRGLEGTDEDTPYLKAIATVKHYALNNSEYNRHNGSSDVDDRALREYYTRAFKGVVQNTGVHSLMTSYNRINGVPAAANVYTLDTLLRRTFGFTGYVTSDCSAINDVYQNHKWQPEGWDHSVDQAETTALCITAGNDLECGGVYKGNAVAAVQRGLMTEDDIDVALVRLFTARMETGEFDDASLVPYRSEEYSWDNQINAPDHTATALQASEEAVALLKNEAADGEANALLPLDAQKTNKLVIVGENDLVNNAVLGDYSGTPNDANKSTPRAGITSVLQSINPDAEVTYINTNSAGQTYFANFKDVVLKATDGTTKATLKPSDAANYDNCKLEGGGNFGYVYNKAWVQYDNVNLDGVTQISVQASGDKNNASHGTFEVHMDSVDGQVIGSVVSSPTSGWDDFRTFTGSIVETTGTHSLYLVCNSGAEYSAFSEADQNTIRNADAVIAYIGTRQSDSAEENDRRTLSLPRFQADMVESVVALNPRTVAYISSVGQVNIEPFREDVPSILWCTYNGQAQGLAAGNLLFGKANPSGKLTFTWYADETELDKIGDYNIYTTDTSKGRTYQYFSGKVSYPFGHGLSYSKFEYSNIRLTGEKSYQKGDVDNKNGVMAEDALLVLQAATKKVTLDADQMLRADVDDIPGVTANDALMILQAATKKIDLPVISGQGEVTPDDTVTVSVDVKNTGSVAGAEVVQAYVSSPKADKMTRPAKQLKGFDKVTLNPGETKTITLEMPVKDWYFWDEEAGKNVYDQGEWVIEVGSSSGDIRGSKNLTLSGDLTPVLTTVTAIPSGHTMDLSAKTISTDLSAVMSNDSFYDLSKATVQYTSANPAVATVDADGVVHSVAAGVTTITASVTVDGVTKTSSFPVAVKNELTVNMITVNGKNIEGFNPSTYQYEVIIDADETQAVVAVPGQNEGITIQQAESIPGVAIVTANNGEQEKVYTIRIRKYHEPVSTEFTELKALPADWHVYDNGADMNENAENWKLTEQGLVLTTEFGDIYQGHNDSKNIFLQPADGDWVADTKIVLHDGFKGGYQQVGFLVFQDEDNYAKISYESGNKVKVVQEIGQTTAEKQQDVGGISYVNTTQYFRIQKTGNIYAFFYSTDDGQTYTKIVEIELKLKNVSLGLTAVNSFNGTPAPIDVAFEYVRVMTMDACTCQLDALTFEDQTVDLQDAVVGAPLAAEATVSGDCPIPGHGDAGVSYAFALKADGENTAAATFKSGKLVAMAEGVVDVTLTAKLANGQSLTRDARITIKNTDPSLVGWFFRDAMTSGDSHTLTVKSRLENALDLTKFEGKKLYLEYDAKVDSTHKNPAPANDDWVKYIVNGWVKIDGEQVAVLGYNETPPSFTKSGEWTSSKVELPASVVAMEQIQAVEFLTYNDTGTKYTVAPEYVDNGIKWDNNSGATVSIKNVKITVE